MCRCLVFFFFKQKTAYEMRISDWSSDVCSSDLTYRGEVTLRQAFAQSINTVAVQLAQKVGINRVIGVAQLMGIDSPLRPEPSLALGTSEVTLDRTSVV